MKTATAISQKDKLHFKAAVSCHDGAACFVFFSLPQQCFSEHILTRRSEPSSRCSRRRRTSPMIQYLPLTRREATFLEHFHAVVKGTFLKMLRACRCALFSRTHKYLHTAFNVEEIELGRLILEKRSTFAQRVGIREPQRAHSLYGSLALSRLIVFCRCPTLWRTRLLFFIIHYLLCVSPPGAQQ